MQWEKPVKTAWLKSDNLTIIVSNDIARGAGAILDNCVRPGSEWVEGSEMAWGNGDLLVRLRKPAWKSFSLIDYAFSGSTGGVGFRDSGSWY